MIEAKHIYKNYGSVEVLKGIDLHIAEGEIVSIIGKSGAGKTTLLQILGLLDAPTNAKQNGSFLGINGEQNVFDISEEAKAKVRNYNIGFIFQQHQLIPEFTALENILIPVYIAKQDIKDIMNLQDTVYNGLIKYYKAIPVIKYRCGHFQKWNVKKK